MATASTSEKKSIVLDVKVSGVPLSDLEAQRLASRIQQSLSYDFGVDEEGLTVNLTTSDAEEEPTVEVPEDIAAEDIASMSPEAFKASKASLKATLLK